MLAASPVATVTTSFGMSCITSYTASPASTEPPGELMNRQMSECGSSAERASNSVICLLYTSDAADE